MSVSEWTSLSTTLLLGMQERWRRHKLAELCKRKRSQFETAPGSFAWRQARGLYSLTPDLSETFAVCRVSLRALSVIANHSRPQEARIGRKLNRCTIIVIVCQGVSPPRFASLFVGCAALTMQKALSACENGAKWTEAMYLLEEMTTSSLRRSTATFNVAISACEKGGQWQRALLLFSEVASQMRSDVVTFSAAITACATASALCSSCLSFHGVCAPDNSQSHCRFGV